MERLLQLRHYAPRTQRSYREWTKRFLRYIDSRGIRLPTADDVSAFLSHLATARKVAPPTHNQVFDTLLFRCRFVLDVDLDNIADTVRARRDPQLPVVFSPDESRAVLQQLSGTNTLMLDLLYDAGLRVGELVTLRVKDIDFEAGSVTVRAGKGAQGSHHDPPATADGAAAHRVRWKCRCRAGASGRARGVRGVSRSSLPISGLLAHHAAVAVARTRSSTAMSSSNSLAAKSPSGPRGVRSVKGDS